MVQSVLKKKVASILVPTSQLVDIKTKFRYSLTQTKFINIFF